MYISLEAVITHCCLDYRYCAAKGVASQTVNSADLPETNEPHYVLATGCNLTTAQKEEVEALVNKNRPLIPFYVITIKSTILYGSQVHVLFLLQIQ
jgi:hypothetical protein